MIHRSLNVDPRLSRRLERLGELREVLVEQVGDSGPWIGSLRRQWRASAAESSIEIEGYSVPADETAGIASGERQPDPADLDRMALSCYGRAMDHVGVMAGDPQFRWVDRVILDLHFDACYFQKDKDPGRYRDRGIEVSDPDGGPRPAYVGPPAGEVAELMREVVDWLENRDLDLDVVVRAAMAHLQVVSVHPFRDGNGRVARIVQSLVLARAGPLVPELISIEEHLGRNSRGYYAALRAVQRGAYRPEADATPWLNFCVTAHLDQARRRLDQIAEAGRRWSILDALVGRRGWPDRLVIALEQSLFDGTDRRSYAGEAGVSAPTASNDLRRLLDAGLLAARGRGPSTRYVASEELRRALSGARG